MEYLVTIAAILVAATALFGWGRIVRLLTGLDAQWPVTIGLGLAVVVFLGGLCNLFHIARPWVFNAAIVLGLGLAALELRNKPLASFRWSRLTASTHWPHFALFAIIIAVGGFVMSTVLVPATFNHHDDFEKYFPQVVRMLATGTVHDNPLGAIGLETFGGEAVLQGFILANFPLDYINGADALFCLLLSLAIVGSVAFRRPWLGLPMVSGVFALLAVDPQYVNVSGGYSLVALSLTLVFATCQPQAADAKPARIEAVAGLLYAAQLAIKLTALSFVGLHVLCWTGAMAWICRDRRFALRRGFNAASWSIAFLLPWIALAAPDIIAVITAPKGLPALPSLGLGRLFFEIPISIDPLLPLTWYDAVAAIVLCYGCVVFARARRPEFAEPARARAASFTAFCVAAPVNYVFYIACVRPFLPVIEGAVRYAAPWLIAGVGAALSLGPAVLAGASGQAPSRKTVMACAGAGLAIVLMFGSALQQRISYAALYGMPQTYIRAWRPEDRQTAIRGMDSVLHGQLRDAVRDAQAKVPPGAPLLAWMTTPFLLDYQRNRIYEIGWSQLVRPWSLIPHADYVLWQYGGFAVRQPADYAAQIQTGNALLTQTSMAALQFAQRLQQLAHKSEVLYDNDGLILLHVVCPQGLAQC